MAMTRNGVDNFIPEVWSARLLKAFDTNLVYAANVNRDYEGDIKDKGDTVRINSIGEVTIHPGYSKNTALPALELLNEDQTTLVIDQGDTFRFGVDDIEEAQANVGVMDEAMRKAGFGFKKVVDSYIAGMYTGALAANCVGDDTTPIDLSTELAAGVKIYDLLVDLGVLLDEADVPEEDRFAILPPFMVGMIEKDDRYTSGATPGSLAVLANGFKGTAAGFKVSKSNQVHKTGTGDTAKHHVMVGHKSGISFAQQVIKTEAYRPEDYFMDAVKGVQIYGAKVIHPESLAVLTCVK